MALTCHDPLALPPCLHRWGPVQRLLHAAGGEVPAREPDVLVACEFSGRVRDSYRARGVEAVSCDLVASETPGPHYVGDVRDLLKLKHWRIVVAFPPCTDTALSGSQYFNEKREDGRQWRGLAFILELLCADADAVLVEQPRSVFAQVHRPPDVTVHPYHFGHGEKKTTCFWRAGRAPLLQPTDEVEGRHPRTAKVKTPSAAERRRRRSIIPLGMAAAIAEQIHPDRLLDTPRPAESHEDALAAMRAAYVRLCAEAGAVPGGVRLESDAADAADGGQEAAPQHGSCLLPAAHIVQASGAERGSHALLLPICVRGRPLVLLPAAEGAVLGAPLEGGAGATREAAVAALHAAAEAALGETLHGGETFLAGERDDTRVVVTLATAPRDELSVCLEAHRLHRRARRDGALACWCSLDALAGDERYELAAEALERVLNFVEPRAPRLSALRTGVGDDAHFVRTAADIERGGTSFDERADAAVRSVRALQRALGEAAADEQWSSHQRECFAGWVDAVRMPPLEEIPAELREASGRSGRPQLSHVPFTRRPPIEATAPLDPPPPPPAAPEALQAVRHVRDIFDPAQRGYERIKRALRRIAKWHRRRMAGRRAKRPTPLALDAATLTPAARSYVEAGGVIDCRDPERVRLLDPSEQPFDTHLNLDAIDAELAELPDRELLSMIRGGVTFKTSLAPQIVIMPNLLSLYDEATDEGFGLDAVTDALYELVDRGWYSTHAAFIPFVPWRCAPRGAVPRPGGGVPRGIVDNGAPRTELLTQPSGDPVVAVNESAGPMRPPRDPTPGERVKWHAEGKPQLSDACGNGAILADIAWRAGLPVYTFAFDFKFFFHQLFLRYGQWWLAGSLMPARLREGGASEELVAIVEKVLSMGTSPSSQVAQRFANAIVWALARRMDAAEQAAADATAELPVVREWLETRRSLPHDDYGSSARLFDAQMFTDDPVLQVVGVERAIRLLAQFHALVGPDGFNLQYARAAKWQGGVHVKWLGSCFSPALGVAWLARDKATRALTQLDALEQGVMRVAELGKLEGLLEHFRFVTRLPPHCMYGIRDAHFDAAGARLSPGAFARPSRRTIGAVARWRHSIANVSGVSILAALPSEVVAPWARRTSARTEWRLSSDAALAGTSHPGLGGYMYGKWWCVPLDAALVRLPIVVLEFIAAFVNVIMFAPWLRAAKRIVLEIDALSAQLVLRRGGAHSNDLQLVHEEALQLPELAALAPHMVARHTYGEGNPASDAASRGKRAFLSRLCSRLGVREEQLEISEAARAFIRRVCTRLGAADRPLPVMGGRYGVAQEAVQRAAGEAAEPPPPAADPQIAPALRGLDVSPACDDHDGPSGLPALAAIRKCRALPARAALRASARTATPTPDAGAVAPMAEAFSRLSISAPSARPLAHPSAPRAPPRLPPLTQRRTAVTETQATQPSAAGSALAGARLRVEDATSKLAARLGLSPERAAGMSAAAEQRAFQMAVSMTEDRSRWRITCNAGMLVGLCRLIAAELESAAPTNTLRNEASNWRHWEAWCDFLGTTPLRNDMRANSGADQEGYEREVVLLAAALPFILTRMRKRPGRDTAPTPLSALQVLRGVRRVHKRLGTPMAPLSLATVLCKKLLADYVRKHGHDALMPKRKEPLTNPIIVSMLQLPNGTPVGSERIDWSTLEWTSLRACYATLAQTGMRKSEVALPAGVTFSRAHLSRAALAWRIGGRFIVSPTPNDLDRLAEGDYALLTVAPSKADQFGLIWSPAPIVLPFHADEALTPICAARELARLERAYPLDGEARREAPLFVTGTRTPLRHTATDERFQAMLRAAGVPPERAATLSMHSWRVYLACALLAKGASSQQILSMLRWRSDEALRLYARLNDTTYATWLDQAADATIDSIRTSNVRPLAEAAAAREQANWLRDAATADERSFDPAATPRHTHDELVGEFETEADALSRSAAQADAYDA